MINKKTKYALKALIYLADKSSPSRPVLIAILAEKERIPKKFLEVILLDLKNNGILQSRKGKGGGYCLAQPAASVKLSQIMRIIEGPIAPLPCLSKTAYRKCDECRDEETCSIRIILKDHYEEQLKFYEKTTLQDMLDKSRLALKEPMYFI